jgi:crotonobetainyl-CoA:carnitine CoA-transferase CaiB-like acyl-CoA transferase
MTPAPDSTPGALDGIVVADFSRVLAGPYAAMLLGDLGATVIKVERPVTGDDTRAFGPPFTDDGQSTYFESVNRGKLSLSLDLSTPDGQRIARALAARADVVIENYKPGTLTRYDLDYEQVKAINPDVVYCSISGFGSGPGKDMPGYDLLAQAMGGLMSITGTTEPTKVGVALVDVLAGLHANIAILAALRHRDATGEGQHLEVSLLSSLLSSMTNQSSAFIGAGETPTFMGNAHPSISPYEAYPTADRPVIVAVGNDAQFARFTSVLGAPELAEDLRFITNPKRVEHRQELTAAIVPLLAPHGADHWQQALTQAGVPSGPINSIPQGFALATQLGLEPVVTIDDPRRAHPNHQVANPVKYSATPATYRSAPPLVGEDNAAVLAFLGIES